MKSFSLKGTTALEFVSDGSSGDDFVFKNVTGDTSVRVDGSFIARDDIEITNVLRMKNLQIPATKVSITYSFNKEIKRGVKIYGVIFSIGVGF